MVTKLADFGLARRITVSAATMGGAFRNLRDAIQAGNSGCRHRSYGEVTERRMDEHRIYLMDPNGLQCIYIYTN